MNRFLKLLGLGVLMSASSSAQAMADSGVIASVITAGGWVPGVHHELLVLNDGRVLAGGRFENGTRELARLAPPLIDGLTSLAADLTSGPLQAVNPKVPECADAPTRTYRVHFDGRNVVVGQVLNCREHLLNDRRGKARTIVEALKGLEQLQSLELVAR